MKKNYVLETFINDCFTPELFRVEYGISGNIAVVIDTDGDCMTIVVSDKDNEQLDFYCGGTLIRSLKMTLHEPSQEIVWKVVYDYEIPKK